MKKFRITNWSGNFWFVALSLFVVTLLSYGQTLWMYFLIDDNALIYKLQHLDQTIGLFGKGVFGDGPYRHMVDQFIPFYPLFGVNPTPYYAVGLILYFLVAITLYLFARTLTKNKTIALFSSLIFASGYVGSETIFGIVNSWQTSRGIIMALVTFLLYYKFLQTRKPVFYLLSAILFFLSLDTVYVRAHGLIIALIFVDLIFGITRFGVRPIFRSLFRLLPFLLIHYKIYLEGGGALNRFGFWHLFENILIEKKFFLISIPLQNLGNLFIPDVLSSRVDKFLSLFFELPTGDFSVGSTFSGLTFLGLLLFLIFRHRKDKSTIKVLIFAVSWMVANFVTFYAIEPTHTLWTTHRYFSYSFIGLSLFWSTAFYLIAKKSRNSLMGLLTLGVVAVYLWLGASYQHSFNQGRSLPARAFFSAFEKSLPQIPKGAVTYFDLANDNQIRGEFGRFFGGIFSEGSNLAIYSEGIDYMNDFTFTYKFDDILQALRENKTSLDEVFTFYYGGNGLVDTSQQTREFLLQRKVVQVDESSFSSNTPFMTSDGTFTTETLLRKSNVVTIGDNPLITISLPPETPSLVPATFSFSMSVRPKAPSLPYESDKQGVRVDREEKLRISEYLLSQSSFRKTAVATSASFWKEQDSKFAFDGRLETAWRGHRGFWDDIDRGNTKNIEYFSVDLKKVLTVSQVMWVSAQRPLLPTHYRILTSLDGKIWEQALEVNKNQMLPEGSVIFDSFSPKQARFVRMEILKTYGNDGPEIKEFEVIEARFADLNKGLVDEVMKEPFGRVETANDYNSALSFIKQNAKIRFLWMSDADNNQDTIRYVDVPMLVDGKTHEYSIPLPATGITWTRFTLEGFNFPAQIAIKDARLTFHSIDE